MANTWKDLDIKAIAKDAASKTDDKLASKISSLSKLTDAEVKKLFPDKGEVATFAELMQIVSSADKKNVKVKQIMENGEKMGGVIVTLLSKIV